MVTRLLVLLTLLLGNAAWAGPLDDYYLAAFGGTSADGGKKAGLQAMVEGAHARCGTPLKHSLSRDWSLLAESTRKTLAKQLAAPVLSGTEATYASPSGRFLIHYTQSGSDAASPAWVQTVAQTFDDVANAYGGRGWRLAPGSQYHVYLRDLAPDGLYGQATSQGSVPANGFPNAFSSYIEIDNNFTDSIYGPYTATENLQITAAHEYHHAIQYGYNFFFDIWYAEATATFFEDELYDGINQLYNYVPGWFNNSALSIDTPASVTTGGGYGRWIFNRFLAEQHAGTTAVRAVWEKLAPLNSSGGNDIPMVPVLESVLSAAPYNTTLGADFLGFAKRVYTREWQSHADEIGRIHPYFPVGTYAAYPVSNSSSPAPSVTLPHYSFAYYKFTPASIGDLAVTVTTSGGISTALFKKAAGTISEIAADPDGSYTVTGFGALNPASDEVVLLVVNTTGSDGRSASFSTAVRQPVTLTLQVSGSGTVNSGNFSCAGGTCSTTVPFGTSLTLLPTPAAGSLFGGWSGACSASNGNCTVTMNGDKGVTAMFARQKPFLVGGELFDTLQAAYARATNGSVIKGLEGFVSSGPVALTAAAPVLVTLKGGYDANYSAVSGRTRIGGRILLRSGTVRMENIFIRGE